MANPMERFLDFLKLSDDDDDFDDDYFEDEEENYEEPAEETPARESRRSTSRTGSYSASRNAREEKPQDEEPAPKRRTQARTSSNKVVPIRTTSQGLEVCICKPKTSMDAQDACEMLMQGMAVVVNLEGIDLMEGQRIMDFIYGCIFAINGKMRQVSRFIFIFSPENVDISGDYLELEDDFTSPTLNKDF